MDNTRKSILARACDPAMADQAARAIPAHIGNPVYVASTNDDDFIEQLQTRKWSVVFFAPGACRFGEAGLPIPGGNAETKSWTLEQYRELVHETQGDRVQIVETRDEAESVDRLTKALALAPKTN